MPENIQTEALVGTHSPSNTNNLYCCIGRLGSSRSVDLILLYVVPFPDWSSHSCLHLRNTDCNQIYDVTNGEAEIEAWTLSRYTINVLISDATSMKRVNLYLQFRVDWRFFVTITTPRHTTVTNTRPIQSVKNRTFLYSPQLCLHYLIWIKWTDCLYSPVLSSV